MVHVFLCVLMCLCVSLLYSLTFLCLSSDVFFIPVSFYVIALCVLWAFLPGKNDDDELKIYMST